MFLFSFICN